MKKNTILYVDDEDHNLQGFRIVFSDEFTILTAQSAGEALNILSANDIQIVISDQRMPEMSGLEFLAIVNEKYPLIVSIILTAYADSDALIQALNQGGIYRFLIKPWDELELRITIKRALEHYHLEVENQHLLENLTKRNLELLRAANALKDNEIKLIKQNEKYQILNEELRENIEQLARMKEKAEESDRLKTAFLQNISHEVRTPMNAIVGFSTLLQDPHLDKKSMTDYTEIIIESSNHLLSIINDVLMISSIEAGEERADISVVDVDVILNDMKLIFESIAGQKGLKLLTTTHGKNVSTLIHTDRTKLKQILTNLISNAVKFTLEGYVEVGYTLQNSNIVFHVKDSGIGISSENHDNVFDRFKQVSYSDNVLFGGTGLGLSISKAFVELLGGEIWLESELSKGSVFYFSLPYTKAGSEALQTERRINLDGLNISILIVEDDYSSYLLLREMLKGENIRTLYAMNGREAVNILSEQKDIDLVITDIKMPVMNGFEAFREIRKVRPEIPVIAQSAYILDSDRRNALNAGFNAYFAKPINRSELLNSITSLFKR